MLGNYLYDNRECRNLISAFKAFQEIINFIMIKYNKSITLRVVSCSCIS